MRSEREMLELILSTAKADDRIRAVILEGSRTNPHAPKDIFQDFDVVYVVGETESFQQDKGWIDRFGERLYLQYPEDHPVYPSDRHHCYGWLMQFADGNRLDLHVSTFDWVLEHDAKDSLFSVLLDKDGLFLGRKPADDSVHWVQKPDQALFSATCNEFWWCLNNLCKGLWRGELSYAQWVMNDLLRPQLLEMLSWKAGMAISIFRRTRGFTTVMGSSQVFFFSPAVRGAWARTRSAISATRSASTSPTTHSSIFPGV